MHVTNQIPRFSRGIFARRIAEKKIFKYWLTTYTFISGGSELLYPYDSVTSSMASHSTHRDSSCADPRIISDDSQLFKKQRQRFEENEIVTVCRVAFRKDSSLTDDIAARFLDKVLKRLERVARTHDVVDDNDLLAI